MYQLPSLVLDCRRSNRRPDPLCSPTRRRKEIGLPAVDVTDDQRMTQREPADKVHRTSSASTVSSSRISPANRTEQSLACPRAVSSISRDLHHRLKTPEEWKPSMSDKAARKRSKILSAMACRDSKSRRISFQVRLRSWAHEMV